MEPGTVEVLLPELERHSAGRPASVHGAPSPGAYGVKQPAASEPVLGGASLHPDALSGGPGKNEKLDYPGYDPGGAGQRGRGGLDEQGDPGCLCTAGGEDVFVYPPGDRGPGSGGNCGNSLSVEYIPKPAADALYPGFHPHPEDSVRRLSGGKLSALTAGAVRAVRRLPDHGAPYPGPAGGAGRHGILSGKGYPGVHEAEITGS